MPVGGGLAGKGTSMSSPFAGWRRRALLLISIPVAVACALGSVWLLYRAEAARVAGSTVFRSPQPTPRQLREYAEELGVRSVLNLRGPNPGEQWYDEERQVVRELGLAYSEYRFETTDWPPQYEVRRLVSDVRRLPRPALLHCESGMDRSGWAAAIARLMEGAPLAEAVGELTAAKGHVCFRAGCSLHRFFDAYRGWLVRSRVRESAETFERWVSAEYVPGHFGADVVLLSPLPSTTARPGDVLEFRLRVKNVSPSRWPSFSDPSKGVRLGSRILGPSAKPIEDPIAAFRAANGPAKDLVRAPESLLALLPGEERDVTMAFRLPAVLGHYSIQIDAVDEGVHWFSDLAGEGLVFAVEISLPAAGETNRERPPTEPANLQ